MSEIEERKIQRGVSVFSYADLLGVSMTLEDCFKDIHDMGATCFELLTSHIGNYPNPSTEWIDMYWKLCEKYSLQPGELGMWGETKLYQHHHLTVPETIEFLKRDFKLANLLGFKNLRLKITVKNQNCDPEDGWDDYIEEALEWAEKYDVRMCTEVHRPTILTTGHIQEYLDFIERTGTKHFGFNVDFGTFQNRDPEGFIPTAPRDSIHGFSVPTDILRVLPYTYCCHAKFNYMDENFEEITIPYKEVLKIMIDNDWSGPLISEYEGPRRDEYEFMGDQLRRHHVMMKNMLGY